MSIERKFRRDGETEYPEISVEDYVFEAEVAAITRDVDRIDVALMQAQRYFRPVDIAKWHKWEEEALLRGAFGRPSKSNKYGDRI